jgi:hypothetical protein
MREAVAHARSTGARYLLYADEYHMPRVARWANALRADDVEVIHRSVGAPRYEYTWEPSSIKSSVQIRE